MHASSIISFLLLTLTSLPLVSASRSWHGAVTVTTVDAFPKTWIENLAIRSDGTIFATSATSPDIFYIDPDEKNAAVLAATIPDHIGLAGIVEIDRDVFLVNANDFNATSSSLTPNVSAVYRVDFRGWNSGQAPVAPTLVAHFADSGLLNGMAVFDQKKHLVLTCDSATGFVWLLNGYTGEKRIVAAEPLMAVTDPNQEPLGVNGLNFVDGWLYFTNTNQQLLARVQLSESGEAVGSAEVIARYTAPDDFQLLSDGSPIEALVAGNDEVRFVRGSHVHVVSDSPLVKGSTSIRRGRGRYSGSFFVTTDGGAAQYSSSITDPGKMVRLEFQTDSDGEV